MAAKACEVVSDVAVVLFDGECQVFACKQLGLGDQAMITVPVTGYESATFDANFVEMFPAGCIITPTQSPGESSPLERINCPPKPKFF